MKNFRVNERIRAHRVKLILSNGHNQGEMLKHAALDMARKEGLDLIEVSSGQVPVCKIADYGKMMYQKKKAEKNQKSTPSVKEIKFKYMTDDHDLETKRKKVEDLLAHGHKVVFSMTMRGREKFVQGNAAEERFRSVVDDFFKDHKMTDVLKGGNSFSVTITPSKK